MKKLLIIANSDSAIYKFRSELIIELAKTFKIGIVVPFGEYMKEIENSNYNFFDIRVNRHGLNPIEDLKLLYNYNRVIRKFKPDVALLYTVKPNIYGSIACSMNKIPCLCNITGLGTAVETPGFLQKLLILMYRYAMRKEHTIFFQNEHGREFFREYNIGREEQYYMLPGSGVNLERFQPMPYPTGDTVKYLFVARIIKEKGIEEFLSVAKRFHAEGRNAEFHICGKCEQDYENLLSELHEEGVIVYHGLVKDMRSMYEMASCVVLPSYYPEGQSNVLLEGAASCRVLITTNHPGCREAVDDGLTGYLVNKADADNLYVKILKIYEMTKEQREAMGQAGRKKIEKEFDRQIVINAYKERIQRLNF